MFHHTASGHSGQHNKTCVGSMHILLTTLSKLRNGGLAHNISPPWANFAQSKENASISLVTNMGRAAFFSSANKSIFIWEGSNPSCKMAHSLHAGAKQYSPHVRHIGKTLVGGAPSSIIIVDDRFTFGISTSEMLGLGSTSPWSGMCDSTSLTLGTLGLCGITALAMSPLGIFFEISGGRLAEISGPAPRWP